MVLCLINYNQFLSSFLCLHTTEDSFLCWGNSSSFSNEIIYIYSDLYLFDFTIAFSTSNVLGLGTRGQLCIFCLSVIINLKHIHQLTELILTCIQNTIWTYKQIFFSILFQVNSRLVTILKTIYATIQDSILCLILSLAFASCLTIKYAIQKPQG